MGRVSDDKMQAKRVNQKLKQAMEEYRVPQVIEYVKLNAELAETQKQIKDWERKIDISNLATRSLRNDIRKATTTNFVH